MAVGDKIRQARQAQGRTVTELAKASGLSRSFVTRVERGDGNPSVESLEAIAGALGTTAARLMADGAGLMIGSAAADTSSGRIDIVRRRREDMHAWRTSEHLQLGFLRPGAQAPLEIALEAGVTNLAAPVLLEDHGGDEFGIVLDGAYELLTEGRREVIHEGDTIRISGHVLHQVRPTGDQPSRILWVVSPPE